MFHRPTISTCTLSSGFLNPNSNRSIVSTLTSTLRSTTSAILTENRNCLSHFSGPSCNPSLPAAATLASSLAIASKAAVSSAYVPRGFFGSSTQTRRPSVHAGRNEL
ncbi:hypothetical protein EJ06DRAFT_534792 [Trichodelitschia bisporula]|uniref:Uncharacterized protein n=1 Tax=Trichodelitschia bisporula TaxID=703511 RepID=A0A6G1HIG1_9PEZI|nr:hypothetical protein EJ06DRAFT_534792 [Trichodelitschia bisporula]